MTSCSGHSTRLLVVDDDDDIRFLFRRFLNAELAPRVFGLEIAEAATGKAAIDLVEHGRWDAIMLDLSLPDTLGFDLLRELRMRAAASPVVVVSQLSACDCGDAAVAAGASAYVQKERVPTELLDVLLRLLPPRCVLPEDGSSVRAPAAVRGRLLVIDDEPMIARVIARLLREHEVSSARDGREGLERLTAGPPFDLVLCDLAMPGMDGIALHHVLSGSLPAIATEMVFLSGGPGTETAVRFLASVPNPHIDKTQLDRRALLALMTSRRERRTA